MGLKEMFFPKKRDFFKMLREQAQKTEEGMAALKLFIDNPTPESGKRVDDLEEEADELRRVLVAELNDSFVTPIDREDIFALSRNIDDIVDYAKTTVEEMILFKVGTNEHLRSMGSALSNSAREITLALNQIDKCPTVALEHVVRARKAENFVEHRYREALAELFNSSDVINVLKMREVYRHISNAADRAAAAADIISDVVVKTS